MSRPAGATPAPTPGEVTRLLRRASEGDGDAAREIYELTYDQLRRLAAAAVTGQEAGRTLQPTALVHEAWLRLVRSGAVEAGRVEDRQHFLASAARAMRCSLVDHARRKGSEKRGGGHAPLPLDFAVEMIDGRGVAMLELDDVLRRLEALSPRRARIVEMRFFGGLSIAEVAEALDVSVPTVKRDWHVARIWLREELRTGQGS